MKTLIIGGGLLGLSSAQALLEQHVEIELLEARDGVGLETSFANGGLLTSSMPEPWNGPGVHRHLMASLFDPHSAMKLRPHAIPSLFFWGIRFLRNSVTSRYSAAAAANFRLAAYAVGKTGRLRERLGLHYDAAKSGTLKIFRDQHAMQVPKAMAEQLAALGLRFSELDTDQAIAMEPQLSAIGDSIAGALHFPDDESGDAHLFCRELAREVAKAGGRVYTGISVTRLVVQKGSVVGVETNNGFIGAERVILAAGSHSTALLKKVGVSLPVRPAKGYSVTLALDGIEQRPHIPVIDDALHAAVVPLGNRLRLAGTAEFAGFDYRIHQERIDNLLNLLAVLYPRLAGQVDFGKAQPWTGLRPMSCDGKPFIGATSVAGLYVNTGHGHLGWTMAMGSACLLADLIVGRTPEIDVQPYRADRYA